MEKKHSQNSVSSRGGNTAGISDAMKACSSTMKDSKGSLEASHSSTEWYARGSITEGGGEVYYRSVTQHISVKKK
ncbi:hypothetical protein PHYPO_G00144200 [Pangasianodon hypophthalmus]|uniref:Uncharacterized protein n=1 Tax=Pangasianodon hypophthalmus TaxID=310915 RepID=A0A5N5K5S8_PANHP|nr:hypothetical protein PHYPO_G00144200 [Pangasianodon hypophthalmus]